MEVLWTAIVLDQMSIRRLLRMLVSNGCVIHPRIFCHHVTLTHGINELPDTLGQEVHMHVNNYYSDEKGECMSVFCEDPYVWQHAGFPHITISCAEGVGPVYSNELLERIEPDTALPKTKLTGVVKAFTEVGWVNLEKRP